MSAPVDDAVNASRRREYASQIATYREDFRRYLRDLEWADEWRNASFDNTEDELAYHATVLARIYDWSKRGVQTFPVIIPQELTPGSITVQSTGSATSDGKTYEGLKVTSSDLQIILLLDASHRLMRLEVPDAKVSVIRD